jgi:hypothetical protein
MNSIERADKLNKGTREAGCGMKLKKGFGQTLRALRALNTAKF